MSIFAGATRCGEFRLGGYEIEVWRKFGLKDDEGNDLMGMYDEKLSAIFILDGLNAAQEQDTLLHEMCHAVSQMMGLELDERTITCLGFGLGQLLAGQDLILPPKLSNSSGNVYSDE